MVLNTHAATLKNFVLPAQKFSSTIRVLPNHRCRAHAYLLLVMQQNKHGNATSPYLPSLPSPPIMSSNTHQSGFPDYINGADNHAMIETATDDFLIARMHLLCCCYKSGSAKQ